MKKMPTIIGQIVDPFDWLIDWLTIDAAQKKIDVYHKSFSLIINSHT